MVIRKDPTPTISLKQSFDDSPVHGFEDGDENEGGSAPETYVTSKRRYYQFLIEGGIGFLNRIVDKIS